MGLLEQYKSDSNKLREQIAEICYFMKGGLSWDEAWSLSFGDRELIVKTLNRRLKEQSGDKKEYM